MLTIEPLEKSDNLYSSLPIIYNKEDIIVDDYIRIDDSLNGRLDTLIEAFYGTNNHMYLVCLYNNIIDLNDVKGGDVIALPNIASLEEHIKYASYKQVDISLEKTIKEDTTITTNRATRNSNTPTFTKSKNGILKF